MRSSSSRVYDLLQHDGLRVAPFLIQPVELDGDFVRALRVFRREELDDLRSHIHAPGRVNPRRNAKGHIDRIELAPRRIELRHFHQ